ncbi:MAG: tetraacyldisaccharide 4'-kinase [Variibacter sp.]
MQAPSFWWRKPGAEAALLAPLAWIYGAIAARRMHMPGTRAEIPVICIGNPTAGGAGKTPTALALAALLLRQGHRPAVLTRGYGGRLAGPIRVDVTQHDASDVGDEALLLARRFPTIVARDRVQGAREAFGEGATVIVMDDGFQNPSLTKDVSILVVDSMRGIGNGRTIPGGPLRAPLAPQLAAAHALLVIGEADERSERLVAQATTAGLRIVRGALQPDAGAIAKLAGQSVLAFAGIGDPDKFFRTLERSGIEAPVRRAFPDHHRYTEQEAAQLLKEAERDKLLLLTTEKDAARFTTHGRVGELARQTKTLPVSLAFSDEKGFLAFVMERIPARSDA